MAFQNGLLLLKLLVLFVISQVGCEGYTNEWAVHIEGGRGTAERVARQLGYTVKHAIEPLDDMYLLEHAQVDTISKRSSDFHTKRLVDHSLVRWAEQQHEFIRSKRDFGNSAYNDPEWKHQWYMRDMRDKKDHIRMDLNVLPVWKSGITGKNVVVTILDDGLEHNNTDIQPNYDPYASYDLNSNDPDPFPRYDSTNENKHGTRCAGEIAMVANNDFCGVGVAYNAKIGGVRMLDGRVVDSLEARAIAFNHTHVDIYSASWGPNDDGKTMEGPGKLAKKAFEIGIKKGRKGKGVIYVWASGNGGIKGDMCNCDGYTASPYTVSISSASESFKSPWYAEHCPSTMATTYSSGSMNNHKIVSADLHNKCTTDHSGTSASAPLAAGIYALALEANPSLTWRDVQHLTAWTSEVAPLQHNKGWIENKAGFKANLRFGFGLLNAAELVKAAKSWKNVPSQAICDTKMNKNKNKLPRAINGQKSQVYQFDIDTNACEGTDNHVRYLEHVQVFTSVDYSIRGNLKITLTSPLGTETALLLPRTNDKSSVGIPDWPFMSVHTWGENPKGLWNITVQDASKNSNSANGKVRGFKLRLLGTGEVPDHYKSGPRKYDPNYIRDTSSSEEEYQESVRGIDEEDEAQDSRKRAAPVISSLDKNWVDLYD